MFVFSFVIDEEQSVCQFELSKSQWILIVSNFPGGKLLKIK